uniref:Mitochondrial fission factor n=1 Tax=Propithecus coquereli TaxID=379532 RepID=A0A2K6GN09_PROCO
MRVPKSIVAAGNNEDIPFSRPAHLGLIQSTPYFLDLKRPPSTSQNEEIHGVGKLKRECSTSENVVHPNGQLVRTWTCPDQMLPEDRANLSSARGILSLIQSSTRRAYQQILDMLEENQRPAIRRRYGISNIDTTIEGTSDEITVRNAASLRRQIVKLNRRLRLLEEENRERARREMIMYSITVAFGLLNSWLWFRR